MRRAGLLLGLAVAPLAGCSAPGQIVAERFEARIDLQADGSAQVEERLEARVGGTTSFRLLKPLERQDAVRDIVASLDGAAAAEGDAPGQVRIARYGGLDVTWGLPPESAQPRRFDVRYGVEGAVAVRGGHATFWWVVLPANRTYSIRAARVQVTLPEGTLFYQEPSMLEQGWTVTRQAHLVTALKSTVAATESATLIVPFAVDPSAIAEPRWQFNGERGRELAPAFISAGLFILVIGAGALVMIRVQYPRKKGAPMPDVDRARVARGLRMAGIVTVLFGVASMPVVQWTLGHYGGWPMAMPASVIASGVGFLVFGARREV